MPADTQMRPTVVSLRTAVPKREMSQADLYRDYFAGWYDGIPDAPALFTNTTVATRHLAWVPEDVDALPTMSQRMRIWKDAVMELGRETVGGALDGVERARVGSFVMASCTGYDGPTPDLLLAREFELRPTLRRTFVGHMGCYAAFNAIKVALDAVAARPEEAALVNCTEICSAHLRPEHTPEQVVVHALFADASATLVLEARPDGEPLQILATHTEQIYEAYEHMTWTVEDAGFRMTLSPYVPHILKSAASGFVERLLAQAGVARSDVAYWGIHPGGPKIVTMVGAALGLGDADLRASRSILANYGNCSSPTILLVLEELLRTEQPPAGSHGVLLAFGPGLTLEGLLVRF